MNSGTIKMANVGFEWQVGGESGEWETITPQSKRPRLPGPWWIWAIVALVILAPLTIFGFNLWQRYQKVQQQVTFQIQSVVDLEAQAWEIGDLELFLEQQDAQNTEWYGLQVRRTRNYDECWVPTSDCWPVWPAEVEDVNVQGQVAWVQVVEGNEPVRRMRFYRKTDLGWKQTAPRLDFWKRAVEFRYGYSLLIHYHEQDQPYVDPLIEQLGKSYYELCGVLDCPDSQVFEIDIYAQLPPPEASQQTVLIPSPWLSGIPLEGTWSEAIAEEALYTLARQVTLRQFPATEYYSLRAALIEEYAVWHSTRDLAQVPLLGRVIARHGEEAVPNVMRSLRNPVPLNLFLARWLDLVPTPANLVTFFETLLTIEQEALFAGRKETFGLLQDTSNSTWMRHRETLFEQARRGEIEPAARVVDLETVFLSNGQQAVLVGIAGSGENLSPVFAPQEEGGEMAAPVAVFVMQEGNWKRNDFVPISYRIPAPADSPIPQPTPTPTPVP